MTMKERILAVVRGEPVDRVPFVMYEGMLPRDEVDATNHRTGMDNAGSRASIGSVSHESLAGSR